MDVVQWLTVIALSLFFLEGFTLCVFPVQFKEMLLELDPRVMQGVGLVEALMAAALIAGILAW